MPGAHPSACHEIVAQISYLNICAHELLFFPKLEKFFRPQAFEPIRYTTLKGRRAGQIAVKNTLI